MNNRERWKIINQALQEIRISNRNGSHVNCLRLHNNNSDIHNDKIIAVAKEFMKMNIPFMTEAEFIMGGRADLINLFTHEIYEIMVTESDESIENKIRNYPSLFKVIKVKI